MNKKQQINNKGSTTMRTKREITGRDAKYITTPVVEAGALLSEYAFRDEEISGFWFKVTGDNSCSAVVDFEGDAKRISHNMFILLKNQYPSVSMKLYSIKTEAGRAIADTSRKFYEKPQKKTRKRKASA